MRRILRCLIVILAIAGLLLGVLHFTGIVIVNFNLSMALLIVQILLVACLVIKYGDR